MTLGLINANPVVQAKKEGLVDIRVSPGSHADEVSVNKQLNDKERVVAALENPNLRQLVDECIYSDEI
ncbi:unnamed protein product [Arabidopsis thaliana]|uniref:Uncharacterized protein n=1 Tax=Arabidopsis thaliana TaxID=3702 RepID=A0A5S9XJP1_ARATH|nr:unnamed protein product [Arabidopsis thaliana]